MTKRFAAALSSRAMETTLVAADRRRIYWALWLGVSGGLCLPIWFTTYIPLVDYPNHLARAYVLHAYGREPFFQAMYALVAEPIPNLALDLIVTPLMTLFEANTAGKIFLTLTVIVFTYGCHRLGIAIHRRPTWVAIVCLPFVYCSPFLYGFVNYQFSIGVFLVAFAVWLERRRRWSVAGFALVTPLIFAGYLAHLSAYVFLGIGIVVITLYDWFATRRITVASLAGCLPLVPPLVAFLVFMRGTGEVGTIEWNSLQGKFINSLAFVLSYNYALDVLVALGIAGVAAMLASRTECFAVKRRAFTVGVCFALLFVLCPQTLFTSAGADARFVPVAVLCVLLSLRFKVPARAGKIALCLLLAFAFVRVASIWQTWSGMSARVATQIAMFESLDARAKIYPVFFDDELKASKIERPFEHSIHYATIRRHAFTPTLFAIRGQQPLIFRAQHVFDRVNSDTPLAHTNWEAVRRDYDYIWCIKIDDNYIRFLNDNFPLVAEADGARIYRTRGE